MVQVASLFNQLLHHFPRQEFGNLVKKHQAERAAKGFDCWTQFVAMLFCQLGHAESLREICNGLACCLGKLVHLGIARAPNKSTLSYANQHRPAALYEELFYTALARFREQQGMGARKHKFRFRNKLLSLDSTIISNQELRRHHRERATHPDLDSLDRHVAAQMAPSPLQSQLVAVQSRHHAAPEPVYLPRFTRLATPSVRHAAHSSRRRTATTRLELIWTAYKQKKQRPDSPCALNPVPKPLSATAPNAEPCCFGQQ